MKIIPKDKFLKGINFKQNLSYKTVIKLMDGNATFILQLCNIIKAPLYSISALAIYIVNYFFHHKSYLNFNRYIHCAAAMFLASKTIECGIKLKTIAGAYL